MTIDLLSDIFDLVHVRGGVFGRLNAGGTWATPLTSEDSVKFAAATHGSCWYFVEGLEAPLPFSAGDILLVNGAEPLVMASKPDLIAKAADPCPEPDEFGAFQYGSGLDFSMLAGGVGVDADRLPQFQKSLPPLIHIHHDIPEAETLGWIVGQLVMELRPSNRQGGNVTISALTKLLFVHALRAHMLHADDEQIGWFRIFRDQRFTNALSHIHQNPAHSWSLVELAKRASMSRTSFAVKFREIMGTTPLDYITNWRLRLAHQNLRQGASVAQAARAAGYKSESAFSRAFVKVYELSPGALRKQAG